MATLLHNLMHGTAIKKHGSVEEIASVSGLSLADTNAGLHAAVANERIIEVDGKYMLSPAGQMIVKSEYSRFCSHLRQNSKFTSAYERFEGINSDLKQLITRWQTIEIGGEMMANDHGDLEYDESIIAELGNLHERVEPVLKSIINIDTRFAVYKEKLTVALEKAEAGQMSWVSDARSESYHTVWFELHEDLLRVLGVCRKE